MWCCDCFCYSSYSVSLRFEKHLPFCLQLCDTVHLFSSVGYILLKERKKDKEPEKACLDNDEMLRQRSVVRGSPSPDYTFHVVVLLITAYT